ncbi:MAG: Minf_1886 family protein [Verrucomicrobiota bacterium]
MLKLDFFAAVERILESDSRFDRNAYHFLKESLELITGDGKKHKPRIVGHVTAHQLLDGVREHALRQFGPMVPTVFGYWGITKCEDFGDMVYQLIALGTFGKSDKDSIEDFKNAYTFHDAFVVPFRPTDELPKPVPARPRTRKQKSEQGT